MKITVYTTNECQFSKQEKEYLNTNKFAFEEKNLETNKDFLTEMLAVSNNFAGTPVTRVEKDDGTIAVLKGFTKEEFDTTFGLAPAAAAPQPATGPVDTVSPGNPAAPAPLNDTPIPPIADTPPAVEPVQPPTDTAPAQPATEEPAAPDNSLQSVMDSLQNKAQDAVAAVPPIETPAPEMAQPVAPPADQPVPSITNNPVDPASPAVPPPVDLPKVPEPDFK